MRYKTMGFAIVVALTLCAVPALAKPTTVVHHPWTDLFTYPPALLRLVVSAIVCYILSFGILALFGGKGYPPTVARLGCWFGAAVWTLWILFGIMEKILSIYPPFYGLFLILCLLVLFGVVLAVTRRRATN